MKYVRVSRDVPAAGVRGDRASWKRTLKEILSASDKKIIQKLQQDGLLPKWDKKRCPRCWKSYLTTKTHQGLPQYQCRGWKCRHVVRPQHLHPLFASGRGQSYLPLQTHAAVLFMLLIGLTHPQIRLTLGVNHKVVEEMSSRLARTRQAYVEKKERTIVFGGKRTWADVEADECTFDRADMSKEVEYKAAIINGKSILWEQWSGILARGKPSTLVLSRLNPALTVKRAPGPGAIRKIDWTPLAERHLKNTRVMLRTNAAKSYKAKISGEYRDAVIHCKKLVTQRKSAFGRRRST